MAKIVGLGVCGPNEKYLEGTLKEFKRLCDDVIIATNNADQATKDLIKKYGFWQYEDNREWGKFQPHIKTDLLKRVAKLRPDWIIALDMDERFAPEFTREEAEKLTNTQEIAWYFMVVNLYNDTEHFAHDVGIQRFWNIRFFKFMPKLGMEYLKRSLHCGLAPPVFYKYGWYAPFYLEHYGLMAKEDRLRKAERYRKYDPNAKYKDRAYYDDLVRDLEPRVFNREKFLIQLQQSPDCQPRVWKKLSMLED